MHSFGSGATSSAGQRTSESPDYAPSQSPRPSLFVTLHLPPGSLEFLPESGDDKIEEEDNKGEGGSLEDSAEDDFDSSSIEEVYDNGAKKFFYKSDEEWNIVDPNEYGSQIVYQSIEYDEENDSQIAGQSIDDDENQSDNSDAHGASATQAKSRENVVDSPTSKLLASCLDTEQSFLYDYLAQRRALAVAFLERNHNILEQFLTRHPDFVLQFLRRNQQQARTLFIEDPTWYVEQHLNKYSYLLENYLMEHPESVEKFINGNPKYFDRYLIRHPEFAINYLQHNRLPSGFGIQPDMFGVTYVVMTPPPGVQTPSPTSAGLPSPDSSPPPTPPPPPPQPVDEPGRKSTTRKSQATRKPPTKPARRSQQFLPKAAPAEAGPNKKQRFPRSGVAPVPSLAEAPVTPDSGPKKTAGPSHTKSTAITATASSSNDSSQSQTYKVLLTSAYGQTAGQFMSYPAPADLLAASRKQDAGTKGSWRLFEEDRAIKHMLDVRDEARLAGETRFEEVSTRLKAEGIERGFFAVKNYWNRTGRARSGFDERKNKTAPLATSKQGKAFRQKKKSKVESKKERGKGVKVELEVEEEDDNDDDDDSEYSVRSEEEDTPPPRQPLPPPVSAPAPTHQKSALKRPADHDDEALAWAMSRGTRPKKQRTGQFPPPTI
jgi:hypothetical protein